MTRVRVFIEGFAALSLVVTLSRLSTDTGGGDYFFTLLGVVLLGSVLPYLVALAVMSRLQPAWSAAVGLAAVVFGALDGVMRVQAFFFPTERSGGGMALWLPLSSFVIIPALAGILRTMAGVFGIDRTRT
jgi:hypothetical protein